MSFAVSRFSLILAACVLVGCSKAEPEGPRLPTTPVGGVVHVDGKPVSMVEVTCHPDAGNTEMKHPVMVFTDDQGRFDMTTYVKGDGLPSGEYALTFSWLEMGMTAKDKFKGKYSSLRKSTHKFSVKGAADEKVDLGTIELKTK